MQSYLFLYCLICGAAWCIHHSISKIQEITYHKPAKLEWLSGLQCCAASSTNSHGFEPRISTNACGHICNYVDCKGSGCHADPYTVSRCHTRGESEDNSGKKAHKRDPPWLWNPVQMSPEVQNRGISGPTKRTYVLQKLKKKQHTTNHHKI